MTEQLDVLEGASDPKPGDLVRFHAGDLVLFPIHIKDTPPLWVIKPANTIEQAGFACSIWSNDGQNFALPDFQTDIQQSSNAAKVKLDVINFELRFAFRLLPDGCCSVRW